ncbi:MAG: oligosaccharide flippase family protein [Lachnospiraceae bacterium]|nr:oligosaccharide flippase family protein [Lachnospiraceae bacterium]
MSSTISYKRFIQDILGYSVSNIIVAIVGIVVVPILTNIFSVEQYGFISLFSSAGLFFSEIASLGLTSAYIRYYNELDDDTEKMLRVRCIVIPLGIILLISSIIIFTKTNYVGVLLLGDNNKLVIIFMLLFAYSQYIRIFINIYYRMRMDITKYTIFQIVYVIFAKCSVIFAVFFVVNNITIAICSTVFSLLLSGFLVIHRLVECKGAKLVNEKKHVFVEMYKYALMSWPSTIIPYANIYITQAVISASLGKYVLGIYSSLSLFSVILTTFRSGFTSYWSSFFYKYYKTEKSKIQNVHDVIMFCSVMFMAMLVIFKDILYLFIGKDFYEGKKIFALVVVNSLLLFDAETTAYGYNIAKKPYIHAIISTVTLLINIVGVYMCGKYDGLFGIGLATAFSGIVYFVLSTYFGQKYYKTVKSYTRTIIACSFICLIALSNYYINNFFTLTMIVGILITFTVIVYRRIIIKILNICFKCKK